MRNTQQPPLDQAAIDKFIADKGITRCPPGAAILGEATPGWRRIAEFSATTKKQKVKQQSALQSRAESRGVDLPFVICHYGRLVSWVRPTLGPSCKSTTSFIKQLQKRFSKFGAVFLLSKSSAKNKNIEWHKLAKLLKAAERRSFSKLRKKDQLLLAPSLELPWPAVRARKSRQR